MGIWLKNIKELAMDGEVSSADVITLVEMVEQQQELIQEAVKRYDEASPIGPGAWWPDKEWAEKGRILCSEKSNNG